jgi:NADPH:quinone reductase-like Zn-dependent oxidoreductase
MSDGEQIDIVNSDDESSETGGGAVASSSSSSSQAAASSSASQSTLPFVPRKSLASVYEAYGANADVVKVQRVATKLRLSSSEVLVRVDAASVNPVDYKMVQGNLRMVQPALPLRAGFDFAGTVARVGKSCRRLKIGDSVFGHGDFRATGSFAQYYAVSERLASLKPESMSFDEAATVSLAALTSFQSLRAGKLRAGQNVLVLGGAGGTGMFGIQIARAMGAEEVVTTASNEKAEFVRELGATRVVNYREENWWDVLDAASIDVIYDCVGGIESWHHSADVVRPDGWFITIVGDKQHQDPLDVGRLFKTAGAIVNRKFWSLFGDPNYALVTCEPNYRDLDIVRQWIEEGQVKTHIDRTFTLEHITDALDYCQSGRTKGKLAVQVGHNNEYDSEEEEEEEEQEEVVGGGGEEEQENEDEQQDNDDDEGQQNDEEGQQNDDEEEHSDVEADDENDQEEEHSDVEVDQEEIELDDGDDQV